MVDEVDLVAVIVTDKNGRTSRRWKRPENVKPGDVLITDEAKLPKRPAASQSSAAKTSATATKKTRARSSVKSVETVVVAQPSWTPEEVLRDSGLAAALGEAAAELLPAGMLVSFAEHPSRVDFLVTDVFGYESVVVVDFENCLSIVEERGVPRVEIAFGYEPRIFRLEGAAFTATFGFGERRIFTLLTMAWSVVAESSRQLRAA